MQNHPDARSYRVKTIPGYNKLRVIFEEETYDGRYSRLACNSDPYGELADFEDWYAIVTFSKDNLVDVCILV